MLEVTNEFDGAIDQVAVAKDGSRELVTNESQDVAEAALGGTIQPVTFELDHVERDGKYETAAWESEFSSRAQLEAAIEREKAAELAELQELEGLTPEAEQKRVALLQELEQTATEGEQEAEGEQQQPEVLTEDQLAQIRQAAVNDAIARGRQLVQANDPQALVAQYNAVQQQVVANYEAKAEAAKNRHSDWDEVFQAAAQQDVAFHPSVMDAIVANDHGPEIAYKLAKNLPLARQLSAMVPELAIMKIGQMTAELTKPQLVRARQRAALQPTKPVGGNVRNERSIADPDIPYSEYYALRERQQKQRHRR